ncbi:hypothetical protein HDU84_003726, partial [Entophlyctis sp. JEL0112]
MATNNLRKKEIIMKAIFRSRLAKQAAPVAPAAPLSTAARLDKCNLYIRVRIGSEHAGVLVLTLTAKTLAAVVE